jgi:hypothetical protein
MGSLLSLRDGSILRREEVGSIVEARGMADIQCCFYLSATRTTDAGVAAAAALSSQLEEDERLAALRAALSSDAAALKAALAATATMLARERGRDTVDFSVRGIAAEEEVHMAYALLIGPLTVISAIFDPKSSVTLLTGTRYANPTRPSELCRPEAFVFCNGAHFQALVPVQPGAGRGSGAPALPRLRLLNRLRLPLWTWRRASPVQRSPCTRWRRHIRGRLTRLLPGSLRSPRLLFASLLRWRQAVTL